MYNKRGKTTTKKYRQPLNKFKIALFVMGFCGAVFYLTVPSDYAGALMFPDLEHHIEPVTGQLVIFNGSTRHGVNTIKTSQERIAISFNYEPTCSYSRSIEIR